MRTAMKAMLYAKDVHKDQRRKYTDEPYFKHLAEVAGLTATAISGEAFIATAYLHDSIEDQGQTVEGLTKLFGSYVANGVLLLSDIETGNRKERKAASRARLSQAPSWVQTIKYADLISNTSSIVEHDPTFARVYLAEKRALLEVMNVGDPNLRRLAMEYAG